MLQLPEENERTIGVAAPSHGASEQPKTLWFDGLTSPSYVEGPLRLGNSSATSHPNLHGPWEEAATTGALRALSFQEVPPPGETPTRPGLRRIDVSID